MRPDLREPTTDAVRLYVIGFDPGVTTGWAVLRLHLDLLVELGFSALALRSGGGQDAEVLAWDAGEFTGPEAHQVDQMMGLVRGVWEDGVFDAGFESDLMGLAMEGFILRLMNSDPALLAPVRILAMFGYAARDVPVPRVVQSPSDAKSVVTDERLRKMNLYLPGSDHRRDATRHAVLLARRLCEEQFRHRWRQASSWLK